MREVNLLIQNGWHANDAFSLDDVWRAAFCIMNMESHGRKFNFELWEYEPVK